MNISFIGYGNMAKAIARGLSQQKSYSISASAPSLTIGMNKEQVRTHNDNQEIVRDADIIILAVKPALMGSVLQEIIPLIPSHCLLISVAAGLNLSWFSRQCNAKQAIVRTMPNTAASLGLSATPLIANSHTSQEQKRCAETIFSNIGMTTWVQTEEEMDTLTALSGSGPAYVFLFMEAMIDAGINLGLDEATARTFTLQTFIGAINLAQKSELSLTELRTKVTSPGGTTAAALNVLHQQLEALILTAMSAAKRRSHELGIENN